MNSTRFIIRKNQYFDSVFLMGINKKILAEKGVVQSAVLMGTQNNKKLLADIGIENKEIAGANANDLIVAVIAETEAFAEQALEKLDLFLCSSADTKKSVVKFRSLADGLEAEPAANLAVISVPGEFSAYEARKALEKGLHVFLFSSNVSPDDELDLKQFAWERNLLVMGPDCGTSIINGKGIGFANRVRKGSIGVIGPSGTGLQEFTSLVHQFGSGISHAIGTGSRDLKDKIGGLTTLTALNMLESDSQTDIVAIVSKPAEKKTLSVLMDRFETYSKPVVVCFLGTNALDHHHRSPQIEVARTIDEAVENSILLLGKRVKQKKKTALDAKILSEVHQLQGDQKYLRGLFAGGTFCYQSQQILSGAGFSLHSNEPLGTSKLLKDPDRSVGHTLVDMGDEFYTMGKPHPMIDGTMRNLRILEEGKQPETAVILLDFILGFNASSDPVGETMDSIIEVKEFAKANQRPLIIVASVTGTEEDAQDLNLQKQMLQEAGVITTTSNASATRLCVEILNALEAKT